MRPPTRPAKESILFEQAVYAAEVVASAEYAPSILAASPEDLIALALLRQPTSDDYVAGAMDGVLQGLRRIAVNGLTTPFVLDPSAAGTLYITGASFQAFEENAGQTNTSTVRAEANGVFVVHRVPAICLDADASQEVPRSVRDAADGGGTRFDPGEEPSATREGQPRLVPPPPPP